MIKMQNLKVTQEFFGYNCRLSANSFFSAKVLIYDLARANYAKTYK